MAHIWTCFINKFIMNCLDLGANIAGSKEEEIETSGVPSTNSGKSALLYCSSAVSELQNQLESIQEENMQ